MTSIKWLLLLGTAAAAACTSDSAAGPPAPPCNATLATDLALGSHWCHRRGPRSEEHTAELHSQAKLVCRLLLVKKKKSPLHCAAAGPISREPRHHSTAARPHH